ncbi:MAG: SDR family oxidoreductase [Bacteroidetes bacterium]|nr:SDR family oxidoreductase [Bacteroidota bacterium]
MVCIELMKLEGKRILILGCGGMLGQAMYHTLRTANTVLATDIDINEGWLEYLDVTAADSLLKTCKEFLPDVIINLAACTDLEFCEAHPVASSLVNYEGQVNVCHAAIAVDATVMYVSTAGVFDGSKDYYTDYDIPSPRSMYGKAKYNAEKYTAQALKKYFIFRAGWMMGGGHKDKKFVKKIFDKIQNGEKDIFIVEDKAGSPTYTWDFAVSASHVLATSRYGLYNMCCQGGGTRLEVASELLRYIAPDAGIHLYGVSSDFFKSQYYAPRPASEKLENTKLSEMGMIYMRDWRVCLREYTAHLLAMQRVTAE